MKIESIQIRNFRVFSQADIPLAGRSAVFFGVNGAGKTTLLDGISILLSRFTTRLTSGERKPINDTDITYGKSSMRLDIEVNGILDLHKWGLGRERKQSRITISNQDELKATTDVLLALLDDKVPPALPVLVYYPVHRSVLDIPLRIKTRHEFLQASAYTKSLSGGADFRLFFEWFRNQEDLENQIRARENTDYQDGKLSAVRQAIYSFMPGFKDLKVMRSPLRMVVSKWERQIQVGQLSDGEKCLMALVGDLARRLAIANPSLPDRLQGTGVVLIDELELHLHPGWQRNVLPLLRSTFPNIQFLITTHSPQVLGEAQDMSVFHISSDERGVAHIASLSEALFGRDSNRLLEDHMRVPNRDPEIKRELESLFDVLMTEHWRDAQMIADKLTKLIGADDPELIQAQAILHRKQTIGR